MVVFFIILIGYSVTLHWFPPLKKLLLFTLLITPLSLFAKPKNYGSALVAEVTSIYDEDTLRVNIKDWSPLIGERVPIRGNDVDAPEIIGKCSSEKKGALLAKKFHYSR